MIPTWLSPIGAAAAKITVEELTRFHPPPGAKPRRGAVLMLFGEGPVGPDLLLTERAHHLRSHPGQVSFPGGSIDDGETAIEAALREAEEETGLDAHIVEVLGTLPDLWLPPSNFSVTTVLGWWRHSAAVSVVNPEEVHDIFRVPVADLLNPELRVNVRHPSGWLGPGFVLRSSDAPENEVLLWGFTAGVISRLFEYVGWSAPWDDTRIRDLPAHMFEPSYMLRDELPRTEARPDPSPATDNPQESR
jgi:8-oxo-dGTP pyrophosphatase MutT (NUDIX family)